jgi:hypothetical protein
MSQRSQYLYASALGSDGFPSLFYGYVNSDKVVLLRVTAVTAGGSTWYYPEIVAEDFTYEGGPAIFATGIGNGSPTADECQATILLWVQSGTTN